MVKLRTLDIVYGNSQGVYQAGDLVHGHVVLECSEQLKLRSKCENLMLGTYTLGPAYNKQKKM